MAKTTSDDGSNIESGVNAPFGSLAVNEQTEILSARGTEDGLVLRIDGRAEWEAISAEVDQFFGGRKKFFQGGHVLIEWLDRLPTKEQGKELEDRLRSQYGLEIGTRKRRARRVRYDEVFAPTEAAPQKAAENQRKNAPAIPLFETVPDDASDNFNMEDEGISLGAADSRAEELSRRYVNRMAKMLGDDLMYDEDANAKVVFGTLRSGQRLETPFSLIVLGDVNPGADLIAGGDIIVFGSLRGTAHASAYDDDSTDRVIIALHMRPMQLRIGSVISRGSDEVVSGAEIARIEDRRIIVESYNPRLLQGRKL